MNKEVKSTLVKTAKVAGVTCLALGGAALIASGAALKAMAEGAKYLKDTIGKIVSDAPEAAETVEEAAEETAVEETTEAAEAAADPQET